MLDLHAAAGSSVRIHGLSRVETMQLPVAICTARQGRASTSLPLAQLCLSPGVLADQHAALTVSRPALTETPHLPADKARTLLTCSSRPSSGPGHTVPSGPAERMRLLLNRNPPAATGKGMP